MTITNPHARLSLLLAGVLSLAAGACDEGPAAAPDAPDPPDGTATSEIQERDAPVYRPAKRPWAQRYVGDIQIDGITSDARSDVYTAGYFVGRAELGPAHVLVSVDDASGKPTKDIFVAKHRGLSGALAWARHFGGAGAEGNVYDLVAGANGTIVASGAFSGSVDFDGTLLTATQEHGTGSASSGSYGSMFLTALSATGAVRWALQAKGDVLSGGNEVAADPSGGFVQVGIFGGTEQPGGTLEIGASSLPFDGGRFDTYVSKITGGGRVLWVTPIGGAGAQRGKAIATDSSGNVLVAGDGWGGETRFAPDKAFTSTNQDFWVAKYDPDGHLLWFRSYASTGVDEVKGIGTDAAGNVIVAASFAGRSIDIGDRHVVAAPGARETAVVFALSPDAKRVLWTNTITSVLLCCELEVDTQGNTFVANSAYGPSVTFGSGGQFAVGGTPRGGLLTKLGRKGERLGAWTVQADDAEFGELTLLADGGLAVAGSFVGDSLSFDGVTLKGGLARTQFVLAFDR